MWEAGRGGSSSPKPKLLTRLSHLCISYDMSKDATNDNNPSHVADPSGSRHHWSRNGRRGHWGGGGPLPSGRKLLAGDVQLLILLLLAEKPAHGYELIREIEERSQGFYAPSPGVIYPALAYLDDVGHTDAEADGKRKLHRITEAGLAHLEANRQSAEETLKALRQMGSRMDQVREAYAGFLDPTIADERHLAFVALKQAFIKSKDGTAEQARLVTKILQSATAEILKLKIGRKDPS